MLTYCIIFSGFSGGAELPGQFCQSRMTRCIHYCSGHWGTPRSCTNC